MEMSEIVSYIASYFFLCFKVIKSYCTSRLTVTNNSVNYTYFYQTADYLQRLLVPRVLHESNNNTDGNDDSDDNDNKPIYPEKISTCATLPKGSILFGNKP